MSLPAADPVRARSIPSLDGLRGVAVSLVVLAHLGLFARVGGFLLRRHLPLAAVLVEMDPGDLGVSIFFVISGYLITTLLLAEEDRWGRIALGRFYLRRFFRIFPPYYAYLGVVALLALARLAVVARGPYVAALLYVSNYYPYAKIHLPVTAWLTAHTWTLSLEEQFYLMWPACLVALGRRRAGWLGCASLLLAPMARWCTLWAAPEYALYDQVDRLFHTRVDTIMTGCVLALVAASGPGRRVLDRVLCRPWLALVAGGLLIADLHASFVSLTVLRSVGLGLEAVLIAVLLAFAVGYAESVPGRMLNQPWLRHLGMISYGLYLWQQMFDGPVDLTGGRRWLGLTLIVGAAELSYWTVERTSYRLRDRVLARLPARQGVAAAVCFRPHPEA